MFVNLTALSLDSHLKHNTKRCNATFNVGVLLLNLSTLVKDTSRSVRRVATWVKAHAMALGVQDVNKIRNNTIFRTVVSSYM